MSITGPQRTITLGEALVCYAKPGLRFTFLRRHWSHWRTTGCQSIDTNASRVSWCDLGGYHGGRTYSSPTSSIPGFTGLDPLIHCFSWSLRRTNYKQISPFTFLLLFLTTFFLQQTRGLRLAKRLLPRDERGMIVNRVTSLLGSWLFSRSLKNFTSLETNLVSSLKARTSPLASAMPRE